MKPMTILEWELREALGKDCTRLSTGSRIKIGEARRINQETKEERDVQFVECHGDWRFDVTMMAERLLKVFNEHGHNIEVTVLHAGPNITEKKLLS